MKTESTNKDRPSLTVVNDTDLRIFIIDPGNHYTLFNRFKTWMWNFILPPHLRLEIEKKIR